jgi:uncharacterized protein (DUF2147 family)
MPEKEDLLEVRIAVQEDDADAERLDQLTRSLAQQLRNLDVVTLKREAEQAEAGAKGDAVTIGAVVLGIAVAGLPKLIDLLQQWTGGNRKVAVQAPNGAKVEFTATHRYSEEEIVELVRSLNQITQQ